MTTRTAKIFGQGFGPEPAEITVTLAGSTIYTGEVPTLDQPVYSLPNPELSNSVVELCSFEIGMDDTGTLPMTCTVLSGTVIFAQILANYCVIANTDPVIGTGPDTFQNIDGMGDARSNVQIDDVLQPVNHETLPGTWWFTVSEGSVLSYDLDIVAGTANVAPAPLEEPTEPNPE
jgi:hypothetical protein